MSRPMAELEQLPERMDVLERKLDALSTSVDRRFADVDGRFDEIDRRFDEVSEHFVEQRQYTELAFARLGSQVDANTESLARLERKLDQFIDSQLRPDTTPKSRRPRRR